MTLLGKLLLLFNLAFALLLAAWSFNIYANGIDWTDTKDTKSTPPVPIGQLAIRAAKLDDLWKGVAPAQADWSSKRDQLANEESRLVAERIRYDKEIHYVLAGPAKGISEVETAAKGAPNAGQMLLDHNGFPSLVKNPLLELSLAEYNAEEEKILKDIGAEMAQHVKQIDEANKLTDKIIGDKAKGIRGLQERINDEKAKDEGVVAELKLVEPQLINTLVEAQLINKRHAQMKKRIEELKRLKVASK
ncbi:MAG TPA: hypothetical protein VMG10_18435 [Gemmataceae bacterium]|nr:hypothetical protein [Gemmataceae bacterium]